MNLAAVGTPPQSQPLSSVGGAGHREVQIQSLEAGAVDKKIISFKKGLGKIFNKLSLSDDNKIALKGAFNLIKECSGKAYDVAMRVAPLVCIIGATACILAAPVCPATLVGVPLFLAGAVMATKRNNRKDGKSLASKEVAQIELKHKVRYNEQLQAGRRKELDISAQIDATKGNLLQSEDELKVLEEKIKLLDNKLASEKKSIELLKTIDQEADPNKKKEILLQSMRNELHELQVKEQGRSSDPEEDATIAQKALQRKRLLEAEIDKLQKAADVNQALEKLKSDVQGRENGALSLEQERTGVIKEKNLLNVKINELKENLSGLQMEERNNNAAMKDLEGSLGCIINEIEAGNKDKEEINKLQELKYKLMIDDIHKDLANLGTLDVTENKKKHAYLHAQLKVIRRQQDRLELEQTA